MKKFFPYNPTNPVAVEARHTKSFADKFGSITCRSKGRLKFAGCEVKVFQFDSLGKIDTDKILGAGLVFALILFVVGRSLVDKNRKEDSP